jgi:hypothetical protein
VTGPEQISSKAAVEVLDVDMLAIALGIEVNVYFVLIHSSSSILRGFYYPFSTNSGWLILFRAL